MTKPAEYKLTLRSEPNQSVSADVRLRQLLKSLLRQWGFRAVTVQAVDSQTTDAPAVRVESK